MRRLVWKKQCAIAFTPTHTPTPTQPRYHFTPEFHKLPAMNHTTETELRYWLTLLQAPQIGRARILQLLRHFDSVEAICTASSVALEAQQLTQTQIHTLHHPNKKWLDDTLRWREKENHHIILCTDSRYPPSLKEIAAAPPILYVFGDWNLLSMPQIAIVGSRNPSHTGFELAEEFGYGLAQTGLVITSGLALGIDTASHQGALNANGKTIAVLGSGLMQIYPTRNKLLAKHIADNGAVISELPLHLTPTPENFPRRNRIISGLSLGTLVIEAALKSGSLITAHYALEQNKDVFAVPGSLRNPMSQGCLALIQQGAKCVTSIKDILDELYIPTANKMAISPLKTNTPPTDGLDQTECLVLACIDTEATSIDQICARSGLNTQTVMAALVELEMKGRVRNVFGAYVSGSLTDRDHKANN